MEKTEKALIAVTFLVSVAIFALWYTIPVIFAGYLDYNYPLLSLLLSVIPFIEILGSIPVGFYVSNGGAKRMGAVGTMLLLSSPVIFVLFAGAGLISIILFALGSITTEMAFGAYTFNVIKEVKMRYIGLVFLLTEFGGVIGASAGGYLLQYYDVHYLLAFIAAALILAVALFMRYMRPIAATRRGRVMNLHAILKEETGLAHRFRHFVVSISIFSFIAGFFDWAIWLLVPLIIVIKSANIFYGGIVYGLITLPAGFGDYIGSKMYSRRTKRRLIIGSTAAAIALMLLMPYFVGISVYILALLFFVSFSIAVTYIAISGYVLENDRRDVAEFYVFETVSYDIGGILGTLLTGVTVALTGITVVSIVYAVMSGAFLAYFIFISKDVR